MGTAIGGVDVCTFLVLISKGKEYFPRTLTHRQSWTSIDHISLPPGMNIITAAPRLQAMIPFELSLTSASVPRPQTETLSSTQPDSSPRNNQAATSSHIPST